MEPNTNKSNWLLIFVALTLVTVGVMVGVSLSSKKSGQQATVTEKRDPSTKLFFTPSEQVVSLGQSIKVMAYMNTGGESVNGVDLKINYDPNVFEVTNFTKASGLTSFAQEIKNDIDNTNGVFRYSVFSFEPSTFLKGTNVALYTLDVKVKADATAGTYRFDFAADTAISASNAGQDMFSGSTPLTITVR